MVWFSAMKRALPSPTKRKLAADVDWTKTPYPNLIRYKPTGNYFGRVRVNGKLIRRSLETHVLSVAKLKVSDFLQDNRRLAINKGEPVKGEVIIAFSLSPACGSMKLVTFFGRTWISKG